MSVAIWPVTRSRFIFQRRDIRGADAPLASATKDGVFLRDDLEISVWNPESDVSNYKLVEPGDFVIGLRSFQHGISHSEVRGMVSPAYTVLRVADTADPRFFRHYFRSAVLISHLASITQGIRQGQVIDMDAFANLEFPVPPLDEQRRIADFLDAETARIDQLMAARRAQVARLGELWDSRLAAAMDEQARIHGWIPLRRLVTSVEQGWSPQCEDVIAEPEEWAVLKTSAVSSGEFIPLKHKRLPSDFEPDTRYQVRDGDVLMTRGSGSPDHVGTAALARPGKRQLLLSDLLYRIRLGSGSSPEFATLALSSRPVRGLMGLLFRGQSGQTIKLRAEDVRSIEIPAVPSALQPKVFAELSAERTSIRRARQSIDASLSLLAERKQALITAAVTGGITV